MIARRRVLSLALLVAAVLAAVAIGSRAFREGSLPFVVGAALEHEDLQVELRGEDARLTFGTKTAKGRSVVALLLRRGATTSPLSIASARREGDRIEASVRLPGIGGGEAGHATLTIAPAASGRALRVDLRESGEAGTATQGGGFTLVAELAFDRSGVFLSDVGELFDVGEQDGTMLVVSGERPETPVLGVAGARGPLGVALSPEAGVHVGPPRILRTWSRAPAGAAEPSSLFFALAGDPSPVHAVLWSLLGVATAEVKGVVRGAAGKARIYGLDGDGRLRARLTAGEGGRFSANVPRDVTRWYAAIGVVESSAPLYFEPGVGWDLELDVSPGGELTARILDADSGQPILARLAVRGIEGTFDPSFGPDYRASGAGPLIDVRSGQVTTPVPSGRYRVSATKGIEWTIDAKDVTVEPGSRVPVELRLRRVVPTDGLVACDLHVHARPSFDSPVLPEDRVLSLVAAGIELAVPTEHNVVGDYGPALELLDLAGELAWVPGVEVTTSAPRLGHFGIFPMEVDGGVPPYRGTSARAIFASARRDPRRVLAVHHPRLSRDTGYFDIMGFDPKDRRTFSRVRLDFDVLEVYSGYDIERPARIDAVLNDYYALLDTGRRIVATGSSDAHRIQYHWAGYPRTMVRAPDVTPIDPSRVVEELKKGRAIVTSGPLIDLSVRVEGAHEGPGALPGDELTRHDKRAIAEVTIHAAPWIDVAEVALVADGGAVVASAAVPSRPTAVGPEPGTLSEARARTLRYRGTFPVPDSARWIMAVARGARRMDDVLAFMPVTPLGFTNPVWLRP